MLDYTTFPEVSNPTVDHQWRDFSSYATLPTGMPVTHPQGRVQFAEQKLTPGAGIDYGMRATAPTFVTMLGSAEAEATRARNLGIAGIALLAAGAFFFLRRP